MRSATLYELFYIFHISIQKTTRAVQSYEFAIKQQNRVCLDQGIFEVIKGKKDLLYHGSASKALNHFFERDPHTSAVSGSDEHVTFVGGIQ